MTVRLSRRTLAFFGLVLVTATVAFVLAGRSGADPKSTPLHGTFGNIQNFFFPACTSVTGVCSSFDASGSIQGSGIVNVDTDPRTDPNGFSKAHTDITTNKGNLACDEGAIFQGPVPPSQGTVHAFVDLCIINPTRSTGRYAGATGYIQEVGTFDFAAGVGSLDYYGQITYGN
jgi:hypothetical protein